MLKLVPITYFSLLLRRDFNKEIKGYDLIKLKWVSMDLKLGLMLKGNGYKNKDQRKEPIK